MAQLFIKTSGRVGAVQCPGLPTLIKVDGLSGGLVLISSFGMSQGCNLQIQPGLDNSIYVYSFGDKVGSIQIEGMTFATSCDGDSNTGIKQIFSYYNANKISNRTTPISIAIGGISFVGFLTDMTVQASNQGVRAYTFRMTIVALPDSTAKNAANAPGTAGNGANSVASSSDSASDAAEAARVTANLKDLYADSGLSYNPKSTMSTFDKVNKLRTSNGLKPLDKNYRL